MKQENQKEYNSCLVCGRSLRGKKSRLIGAGPVCRKKASDRNQVEMQLDSNKAS